MYIFFAGAIFTFFCFYLIWRYLGWHLLNSRLTSFQEGKDTFLSYHTIILFCIYNPSIAIFSTFQISCFRARRSDAWCVIPRRLSAGLWYRDTPITHQVLFSAGTDRSFKSVALPPFTCLFMIASRINKAPSRQSTHHPDIQLLVHMASKSPTPVHSTLPNLLLININTLSRIKKAPLIKSL